MDERERIRLIRAAAKGEPYAIRHWAEAFTKTAKSQCRRLGIPYSGDVEGI